MKTHTIPTDGPKEGISLETYTNESLCCHKEPLLESAAVDNPHLPVVIFILFSCIRPPPTLLVCVCVCVCVSATLSLYLLQPEILTDCVNCQVSYGKDFLFMLSHFKLVL